MDRTHVRGLRQNVMAEFGLSDTLYGERDKFGLTIHFTGTFYTNSASPLRIFLQNCRISFGTSDSPVYIGSCKLQFVSQGATTVLHPGQATTVNINTRFHDNEIVLLERFRQYHNLSLNFEFSFILLEDNEGPTEQYHTVNINPYVIAKSTWESILKQSNYLISEDIEISPFIAADPSWRKANEKLQSAKQYLHAGDGATALKLIDKIFKEFVVHPYLGKHKPNINDVSWFDYISENFNKDIEKPKQQAIAQLLIGLGGYLNKISHHEEDLTTSISQYEHELITAISLLMLTYLYRVGIVERDGLQNNINT